jgi:hypothetical protein
MNKETREVSKLIGQAVNAGFNVAEDGKLTGTDTQYILPLLITGGEGIKGIKAVPAENISLTIEERMQVKAEFTNALSDVDDSTAYDLAEIFSGALAGWRLGQKAGKKEGRAELAEELKAGKVKISDL